MVLPSNGRACMQACFDSLVNQADHLFLVRNADFRSPPSPGSHRMTVLDYREGKLPIHQWWNLGIEAAEKYAASYCCSKWNTLIVNDDVVASPDAVPVLAAALRDSPAALASPYRPGVASSGNLLMTGNNIYPPGSWLCGWFFMLRGEVGLRADMNLNWWFGDNDLEWQARHVGGALLVQGCNVTNQLPGGHDGMMAEEIQLDGKYFAQKWPQAAQQPR
jgi:hypothetical protein